MFSWYIFSSSQKEKQFGKTISFFFLLFCFVIFYRITLKLNSQVSTQLTFSELPHTARIHTLSQCLEQSDKDYTELKNTEHLIMAAWTGAARHAVNFARLSSPKTPSTAQAASLIHRRGLAGGGGNLSFIPFYFLYSLFGC